MLRCILWKWITLYWLSVALNETTEQIAIQGIPFLHTGLGNYFNSSQALLLWSVGQKHTFIFLKLSKSRYNCTHQLSVKKISSLGTEKQTQICGKLFFFPILSLFLILYVYLFIYLTFSKKYFTIHNTSICYFCLRISSWR